MSEIKSEYKSLNERNEYDTHFFKTSADLVVGLGRMKSTAYTVGDVVYVDSNMKVALKCITEGTTSDQELDLSSVSIGKSIADGGVVWKVCNRTSDVTSVNGQTGDVTVGKITDASISGKVITLTFADGTTKTLTTQDTGDTHYMPNWDATVSVTFPQSSAKYTAPSNGIYFCCFYGGGKVVHNLYINGVARLQRSTYSSSIEQQPFMTVPLNKGDVIYWDKAPHSNCMFMSKFVPYKTVS